MSEKMAEAPVVRLENGARVANFSSPHPFRFDDGTVLPACDTSRVEGLKLSQTEVTEPSPLGSGLKDVRLQIEMTLPVAAELDRLDADDGVDVVLVPFMVLEAIRSSNITCRKARVCRTVDRQTRVISAERFCV